jgi:hypothetical protein
VIDENVVALATKIREVLVDFLDWETVYPNLGMTQSEAQRDYNYLTLALVAALTDGIEP